MWKRIWYNIPVNSFREVRALNNLMKLKQNKIFLFFLVTVSLSLLLRCGIYLYNLHNYGSFTKIKGFEKNKIHKISALESKTRFVNINANQTIIFSPIFLTDEQHPDYFNIYLLDNNTKKVVKKHTVIKAGVLYPALLPDNKIYIIAYKAYYGAHDLSRKDDVYTYDYINDKLIQQEHIKIKNGKTNTLYSVGTNAIIAASNNYIFIGHILCAHDQKVYFTNIVYDINRKEYKKAFDDNGNITPESIYVLNNKTFLIYGSNTDLEFYIKRYDAHINKLYAVDIKNNSPFWKQEFLNNATFIWLDDGLFLFNENNDNNKKNTDLVLIKIENDTLKPIKKIRYSAQDTNNYLPLENAVKLNKNQVLFVGGIISTGWISHINSKQVYLLDIPSSTFIRLNNFPYKLYTQTLHTLDGNKILLSDGLKCNLGLCTKLFTNSLNNIYLYNGK